MLNSVPGMINCLEFDAFLVDYLEHALPAGQSRQFRLHLLMCPDCRRYLKGYRHTIDLARTSMQEPDEPVSEEVPDELVQAILSAQRADSPRQ